MLFETTDEYQERLKAAWPKFINDEPFDYSFIRPEILESWRVSRYYNVAPYTLDNERLSEKEMQRICDRNADLISIARPEMERLYSIIRGSNAYIILTDNEGITLYSTGDKKNLVLSGPYTRLVRGSSWNIEDAGTNSISLCLATKKPCQVHGEEHYRYHFKSHTCSGSPIFNIDGSIVGTINISALKKEVTTHTLGAMVTSAQTIEHALKLHSAALELTRIQNASTGSFSFHGPAGLILLNYENRIVYINPGALQMLGLNERETVGQPLFRFIRIDNNANSPTKAFLHLNNNVYDLPTNVILTADPEHPLPCNISLHRINNLDGQNCMTVLMLSPPSTLRENSIPMRTPVPPQKSVSSEFKTRHTFASLIGSSPAFLRTIAEARHSSQNCSNVLITGESGTGKELFAQAIHSASNRRTQPFVAINCGAIPRSLVESELFGYEQGAFTGGKKGGSPGKFELANGGTLFLDEVGEMPLDIQVSLLRVLETHEVMRLGGSRNIELDVRIIAATNRDLGQAIKDRTFREDLYYRLNVLTIHIPALRDRRTDIIDLMHAFICQYKSPCEELVIGENVQEALMNYPWPGNVRELSNVIQRAMLMREGNSLELSHLSPSIQLAIREKSCAFHTDSLPVASPAMPCPEGEWTAEKKLFPPADKKTSEELLYTATLEKTHGNVQEAAVLLNMNLRTLYRRLDKYSIYPKSYK